MGSIVGESMHQEEVSITTDHYHHLPKAVSLGIMDASIEHFSRLPKTKMNTAAMKTPIQGGNNEIEATKHLVTAAKKWMETAQWQDANATQMMEAASHAKKDAESQVKQSQKDLKDAIRFLESVEKRWEVIDVDDESRKRQRTILPVAGSGAARGARAAAVDSGAIERKANNNAHIVDEMTVNGCGISEINGIYKKVRTDQGVQMYSKGGSWEGKLATFCITRHQTGKEWWILMHKHDGKCLLLYYVYTTDNSEDLPPRNNWHCYRGSSPAPQVYPKYVANMD